MGVILKTVTKLQVGKKRQILHNVGFRLQISPDWNRISAVRNLCCKLQSLLRMMTQFGELTVHKQRNI